MANSQHYDAVVISSGQGGSPLAGALAAAGRKTAIIEREHVGGTCINEGCTLYSVARRRLRPPNPRRVTQHPVRDGRRLMRQGGTAA
ncbi:hypothetical protein AVDCRST_MAG82-2674 [uncultured Rubrobacteraceae bacterium]|uniref:PF00070 family, FAD-dependent NAD(P)-disulphide oxidoreductase n=1 Tax=uncultured Rubrobacteraceae bacterium TaxID=349277 RepID=A0A6J4QEJ5_9ACTN|nr:hypothetical protein AVDCRST_MAG82-2674 [uncultured Rubrobacteraceae bacterium]